MTTCPTCGSETAAGATCVVCGADPTAAATEMTTDDFDVEDADPGTDDEATMTVGVPVGAGVSSGGDAAHEGAGEAPPTGPSAAPVMAATAAAWPATPPPHPDAIAVSEASRNWGMIAHLSALVAAGVGGLSFLGPLIVWLVRKDQDRFVAHHAVEALNFNLSLLLYALLAGVLVFTVVGIPLAILMALIGFPVWFIVSIVAAVKAQRGEGYRYPLTIRLIRE